MKSVLYRSVLIVLGTLVAGLLINAANPFGIKWSDLVFCVTDSSVPEITVEDAFFQLHEPTTIFLDIRPHNEYEIDHISGAISLYPVGAIGQIKNVPGKDRFQLIAYDFETDSPAVRKAVKQIRQAGFTQVCALSGGFAAWLERGLPVDEGEER